MTNETLLSYILKNKEGKKKKNRRVRGPSSLGPHAWAWFYFYYYFIKMWTTCHSSLFLYIKKKTQTMCCLQAQILATTVVHETSGQPLFWLKKLNF